MSHIELLLEEQSIVPVIESALSQILTQEDTYALRVFQGKPDLLRQLPTRLKGYEWMASDPNFAIVIVVDRDDDDCRELKSRIRNRYTGGQIVFKSQGSTDWHALVRIVVEEMEAWLFGDWEAVCAAFPKVKPSVISKAAYRHSDDVAGGTAEAFQRVLRGAGYESIAPSKTSVATMVAKHMKIERNTSPSFRQFCNGIRSALQRTA